MNNLLNRGKEEEEELELVDTVQATLPHGQTTHIPVFAVKTMPTAAAVVAAVEKIDDDAPPLVSLIPETVRLLSVAGVVKPPPPLPPPQTVSVSPVILSQRGESMVQGAPPTKEMYASTSLVLQEEPEEKFRFRYKSEMQGTHGCIHGKHFTKKDKHFPTVKVENVPLGVDSIKLRLGLYFKDKEEPVNKNNHHVHKLMWKQSEIKDEEDFVETTLTRSKGFVQVLQGLGIIHTSKRNVKSTLFNRKKRVFLENKAVESMKPETKLSKIEEIHLEDEAKKMSKMLADKMNSVTLGFEAFTVINSIYYPLCEPKFSNPIRNLKNPTTGDLKITRMSCLSGSVLGGDEVFIFTERVIKGNIKVRFFQENDDEDRVWEEMAVFTENDVHHQYAIAFKTPAYKDEGVTENVDVYFELYRPSDDAVSEKKTFRFKPTDETMMRKRRRIRENMSENLGEAAMLTNINSPPPRFNIANFNPHQLHPQQQQQQQIPQQINLQQQQQQQQGLSINNTTNHFAVAQSPASSAAGGPVSPSQQVPNQPHQLPSYASTRQQSCEGSPGQQANNNDFNMEDTQTIDMDIINDLCREPAYTVVTSASSANFDFMADQPSVDRLASRGQLTHQLMVQPLHGMAGGQHLPVTAHPITVGGGGLISADSVSRADRPRQPTTPSPTCSDNDAEEEEKMSEEGTHDDASFMTAVKMAERLSFHLQEYCSSGDLNQAYCKIYKLLGYTSPLGNNTLHEAVLEGHMNALAYILEVACRINFKDILEERNNRGDTPLHLAIKRGRLDMASLLLKYRCCPNACDGNGNTTVHLAVLAVHLAMPEEDKTFLNLVLDYKPNLNITNNVGLFPLHIAVQTGSVGVVMSLVEAGHDVDAMDRVSGQTPLHMAITQGNRSITEYLVLQARADPTVENFAGKSSLQTAEHLGINQVFTSTLPNKNKINLILLARLSDYLQSGLDIDDIPHEDLKLLEAELNSQEKWRKLVVKLGLEDIFPFLEKHSNPTFLLIKYLKEKKSKMDIIAEALANIIIKEEN